MLLSNYIIFNDSDFTDLRGIRAKNVMVQTKRWLDMRGFGGLVESTGILRSSSLADELVFDPSLITAEGLDFVIKWNLEKCVRISPKFLTLYRISENQLHNDLELTTKNMSILANRYSQVLKMGGEILRRQNAYFVIANMRNWPKTKIASQIFLNLMACNVEVFFMAIWIISRNLRAKLLSRNSKKIARDHLLRLNV
jgi:hypothetical protein